MNVRLFGFALAVVVVLLSPPLAVAADPLSVIPPAGRPNLLYGISPAGELVTIDPALFVERKVGRIGIPRVHALAYDPRADTLYGLTEDGKLLSIDRRTGKGRVVQAIAARGRPLFSSLAFEPGEGNGRLYATNVSEGLEFFRIDLRKTAPHPVVRLRPAQGDLPAHVTGLAVHPGTGQLYGVARNLNALGTLDPNTGAFKKVFPNCGIDNPEGLAFEPLTRTLYGVFAAGTLGIYDLASGSAMAVGRTTSTTALASAPAPAPETAAGGRLQQQQAIVCDVITFPTVPPFPPPVSWNVCLYWAEDKGIWISSAEIQRTPPNGPWTRVLSEAGPAEIFTPYHGMSYNSPPRMQHLLDMNPWACVSPVNAQDAANGTLLTIPSPALPWDYKCVNGQPNVVREMRDRGIAYLCKNGPSYVRRGQEVVYWSVFDPGNYDFIVEYGFGDDGTIRFRMGATGFNNPNRPDDPHVHSALWRINADIGGAGASNSVFVDKHTEPMPSMTLSLPLSLATDTSQPVTYEQFVDLDPMAFTALRVENPNVTNFFGHPIGYGIMPLVHGISRHYNILPVWPLAGEIFAQHDFAVTKSNPNDLAACIGILSQRIHVPPDDYLLPQLGLAGIGNAPEPVTNSDVVLWYRSSIHHMPTSEDRPNWPGHWSANNGITLVHWMGFDFMPHDFFDYNPLGGPVFCGCGNGICDPNEDCCSCPGDCGGNVSCC